MLIINQNTMSKKFTLNKEDFKKVLVGLLIAMGGAGATYLTDFIANTDFGEYTPLVVAAWSVVINLVRKFLTGK